MTISILAFDENTGVYGGAAATGILCVGAWVLRGDPESGLSASQGSLPSTMWGADVLALMKDGEPAAAAVQRVVEGDDGRDERQLSALDPTGSTGAFTGANSIAQAGVRHAQNVVVAGNLLASEQVLDACLDGYTAATGTIDERLIEALCTAARAGGDARGLLSAALLVVGVARPPLSLRVDHAAVPLQALTELHRRATTGDYARWTGHVPTLQDPERSVPFVA
jgi:uncharacterized Ntn-hydrolase superfamily protein